MKRKPEKPKERTGAPDATFLRYLEFGDWTKSLVQRSQPRRADLRRLTTQEVSERIRLGLYELYERVGYRQLLRSGRLDQSAAKALAAMASLGAAFLRDLAFSDSPDVQRQIELAASEKHHWPVNLSLGSKKGTRVIEGAKEAKAYLNQIRLATNPQHALKDLQRDSSIFKSAAQLLLQALLDVRKLARPKQITSWYRGVFALEWPMTKSNVEAWWLLGKEWMDEQWETNPELFAPLKEACSSKGKKLTKAGLFDSEIKARVIDSRLKGSFFARAEA